MDNIIIFRKDPDTGEFPTRSSEVVSGSLDAYSNDPDMKAIPWEPDVDKKTADHYELVDGELVYAPPAAPVEPEVDFREAMLINSRAVVTAASDDKISNDEFINLFRQSLR